MEDTDHLDCKTVGGAHKRLLVGLYEREHEQ